MAEPVRCAIYTRKSSEEGLEQEFNSLHAQREACEAYVLSQKHEGWQLLPEAYDDGGISGGTLERPGLKALLAQVEAGKVDTIVVYKVDRLTRSLADFAKLVELFDRKGVSFVSVTQAFNTTTSMGRLTLNVLLSFAQFEREVTGERIRDKIAASKAKGLWMGGRPPLGYDPKERTLVVNQAEAEQVRLLYEQYLKLGSVDELVAFAADRNLTSKAWTGAAGQILGGQTLRRGALYHILANPVYIGLISHREKRHAGQHEPILSRALFNKVQKRLTEQRRRAKLRGNAAAASPFAGIAHLADGTRLTPTHTKRRGKRYRYYANTEVGIRISAALLEQKITAELEQQLGSTEMMASKLATLGGALAPRLEQARQLGELVANEGAVLSRTTALKLLERVVVNEKQIDLRLHGDLFGAQQSIVLHINLEEDLLTRNGSMALLSGSVRRQTSSSVLTHIAQGRIWFEELTSGVYPTVAALAAAEGVSGPYISNAIDLAFTAPSKVDALFSGKSIFDRTMADLKKLPPVAICWSQQALPLSIG